MVSRTGIQYTTIVSIARIEA